LGSTSLAVDASTGDVVETRYKPWGEVRFTTASATLPTRYTFTGQYSYVSDSATDLGAAGFGLMFYNARWYDPMTGRMAQADTIVPGGVQGLDRYAYVNNSPVMYADPTGHYPDGNDYWSISLTINLSNSISVNTQNSQYYPNSNSGLSGSYGNLCGDIALEMIHDTYAGSDEPLAHFFTNREATSMGDNATNAWQLGAEFAKSFPAGWTATTRQFGFIYQYESGNPTPSIIATNDYQQNISYAEVKSMMVGSLVQGHCLIMLVTIDAQGGLVTMDPYGTFHWVVISRVAQNGVTIVNPFTNRLESYSWDQYLAAFGYGYVELTPPPDRIPRINFSNSPPPIPV
jgi:RHS repeat-associated protein